MKYHVVKAALPIVLLASAHLHAMTLEEYLDQVRLKNGGVRSTKISAEAKGLRMGEGSLFFKPSFFLNGEYYDDQRPTNAPSFQGIQTLRHTVRTGLSQNLRTGTRASVSYNYYKTQIIGANPNVLPNAKFFDVAPMLEVTQSLWRNFLGAEFEAQEKLQNSQAEAQKYTDEFAYKQLLIQAETAYWRLYFAQTALKVQRESLERAKRLRDWSAGRYRNNLVDESELLQAEANLQNREMEQQDTLTEVESALRNLNAIRETQGEVNLELEKDTPTDYISKINIPKKAELREDVKAKLAANKAAIASAELGTQRNRPQLELYGSYSINGRNQHYSAALDQSMTATRPFSIVGVRFTTQLDLDAVSDVKKSYAQDVVASEMSYKRRAYEVEQEWDILVERFNNLKKRFELSQKLEKAQEKKLVAEKRRYDQGRTTIFQVLQFEQDFANAQLVKLKNKNDLIATYNQLKLFSGESYE